MNIVFRPAVGDDAPVLEQLEQECFPDPSWDGPEFLQYHCTVAEVDGRIAGFIVTREVFPSAQGQPAEREVLNIAVAPVFRRLGIGTALLEREIRPGANHFLEVRESNTAARNLYKKLGFTEVGSRKNYYDNPQETAIVMHRK